MRILIAEDDPKLLKSLVHIFELNHYSVDGLDNGTDAFDYACSGEYDGLKGNVTNTFTESIYSITDDQAVEYAKRVVNGNTRGWADNYRYKVYTTSNGRGVVFIDGSLNRSFRNDAVNDNCRMCFAWLFSACAYTDLLAF